MVKSILSLIFILSLSSISADASSFLWGAGSSSFQVEGSPVESNWLDWTRQVQKIDDGTNADQGTDFWNRYEQDFALAKELKLNAFRISLAWERIEPSPGVWNFQVLAHYREMILAMRANGLEPVVTIYHFTMPKWLADRGGVNAEEFSQDFADYAKLVVNYLGKDPARVRIWITINEPDSIAMHGYITGKWPPGNHWDFFGAAHAEANLIKAHIKAAGAIRSLAIPDIKISIAKVWLAVEPEDNASIFDGMITRLIQDVQNIQMLDALMTGKIRIGIGGLTPVISEDIALPDGRPSLDFIGINYYFRFLVGWRAFLFHTGDELQKNDLGWEIYPHGIYEAITKVYSRWKLPVLITENGIADRDDTMRSQFLRDHLTELAKAKSEGIPVMGYLYWAMTDNFEWSQGLSPRFGITEIDYTKNLERKLRASSVTYKNWIQTYPEGN